MFQRYAIYYTPAPDTALAEFGAEWLGWDSATGQAVVQTPLPSGDVADVTAAPHKYGFHGTIKPPFYLSQGARPEDLLEALHALCATAAPVVLERLVLSRLGAFLALTPEGDAQALGALAARVVEELDGFRAPPDAAELARRRARPLRPEQEANLVRWGYPYVRDQFRFHMTLTGRLAPEMRAVVSDHLASRLAGLTLAPYTIGALTLLGSDSDGRFHQWHRIALSGAET